MEKAQAFDSINEYISSYSGVTKERLEQMYKTIKDLMPADVEEGIVYAIPTFRIKGKNVVHFGGYAHHIGFYPTPDVLTHFAENLNAFKGAKGSVQFPHDQPLPLDLVIEMTKFRLQSF